jgi:hypothetical protein
MSSNSRRVSRTSVRTSGARPRWRPGVRRQRLLGLDAPPPQLAQRRLRDRVVGVERARRLGDLCGHPGEHRVVEVDAAQVLDTRGPAEHPGAVAGVGQHGGVERAAAQVVDGHDLAGPDATGGGVVRRHGLRLGDQGGPEHAGEVDRLADRVTLVRPPVGRAGDHDLVRWAALPLRHPGHHGGQQPGGQRLGRERRAAQQDRRVVAHPALELPGQALGLAAPPALGGLPDQQLAVGP